ncbi:MAG: gluconate 2-dehydrogenase subunit 3 family protein [Gammaproteobacteria bacterium]|nr:gluconate 2-dehydrogenase subunit 3 family protein [Gammaproteobacteria bacterium]MYC52605.1 gluconate 2-dehydrogenase subunit 3 family protein [Gammaproteobacteria bacterium]
MKRRRAIGVLGGIVGGPLLAPEGAFAELVAWADRVRASAGTPAGGGPTGPQVAASLLTPPRARVMAAMAEAIIPVTDTPGASEAGVTEFVAALVDGWLDDDDRDRFLAGLDTVDPAARDRFGADFADCTRAQQAALVGNLDAELTRLRDDADTDETQHFFHDVKRFTLTAYFTSEVGLEAIGYRITFPAFEGCAPLTDAEAGRSPGADTRGSSPTAAPAHGAHP